MEIHAINLLYFIFAFPFILVSFPILSRLAKNGEKNNLSIIIILSIVLFAVRFVLIFFAGTIGIMPYLIEDVVFYPLLALFGILITIIYVKKVEGVSLEEIGWVSKDLKKSIGYGLLSFLPLVCLFPLIIFLADIQLSTLITWEKCVAAGCFAILGAIYEEFMFRGVIQNKFMKLTGPRKTIFLTALTFTLTHLFYLPFAGFGIYYMFVFVMALLLSILRFKVDQVACTILHGGIVFILIIAV